MSCGYHQCLTVYVAVFLGISMLLPPALGAAQFTKTPNDKTVKVGDKVSIVWDYSVDNRGKEFQRYSPEWRYYNKSGTNYELASEDKLDSWKWKILSTCPARLKHRLSKADTATLVITNVSLADSGKYQCVLKLTSLSPVYSSMQLTITVSPEFTPAPPSSKTIKEGDNLSIQCSAKGPPTPQVKWLHNGNILSQGQGSVTLNIVNIKRSQSGIYECQASNNPNEQPAKTTTQVAVYYPPVITTSPDNTTVTQGDDIILKCQASGNPPANISWSRDNSVPIKPGHTVSGGTLTIPNAVKSDAGKYICTAKNVYDGQVHTATEAAYVTVRSLPSLPDVNVIIHQTSVTLVWSKPDENGAGEITNYTIYKKVIGIDFSWSKVADVTATYYTVEDLDPGKKYSFIVTARNQYGESLKDESKAKTVVIPVETTTITTTAGYRTCCACASADHQKEYSSTVVGVLAAFLAVSLLVIVLLVLYIWRIRRRTKSEQRMPHSEYENVVEMAKTSPSSATTLHVSPANQPGVEYEPIQSSRVQPQYEIPQSSGKYEIPDNRQTTQDPSHYQQLNPSTRNEIPGNPDNRQTSQDPSHYQQLNPSTITSQHNDPSRMYEPLS